MLQLRWHGRRIPNSFTRFELFPLHRNWMFIRDAYPRVLARTRLLSRTEPHGSRWLRYHQLWKHSARYITELQTSLKKTTGFDILTRLLFIVIYLRNKGYESNFDSYSQDVIQHLGAPYDYGKKKLSILFHNYFSLWQSQ